MKKVLRYLSLAVVSFGSTTALFSQSVRLDWAVQFGGVHSDAVVSYAVTTDAAGNVYTTGHFTGMIDFDPGTGVYSLIANGEQDVFISKLDANGNFIWAKSIGDTTSDGGYAIALDNSGNVYTTGYFQGTVDFDPGPGIYNLTSAGGLDVFISKLDPNGNFLWAKAVGGNTSDTGNSIKLDPNGNLYVMGVFMLIADFDPGTGIQHLNSAGGSDVFILKLDPNGNFIWVKQIGGIGEDYGSCMAVDDSGNSYVTGVFQNTADFDPGPGTNVMTSLGGSDAFILKLDPNGNFTWSNRIGGKYYDGANSIAVDGSGNTYILGSFSATIDPGIGSGISPVTPVGNNDVFILKLHPDGNYAWIRSLGGPDEDFGNSIAVDLSGNSYSTGYFGVTVDLGQGIDPVTSKGDQDVFISKMDPNGNFTWMKQMGGANSDFGMSIHVDDSNNIYTTGYFLGVADFDPGNGVAYLDPFGKMDVFVQKLSPCQPTYHTDSIISCGSYKWIDEQIYTSSTNAPTFTLVNSQGCDSIVSLHLTVKPLGTLTQVVSTCGEPFTWTNGNGQMYTSSTVAEHLIPNGSANGCDSVVKLNLTITSINPTVSVNGIRLKADQGNAAYQWIDCDLSGAPVPGATAQAFVPRANGNYAVIIQLNGCSDTSECFAVTGLIDPMNWSVYPNPAEETLFVETEESMSIRVFDIASRLVLSKELNAGINPINISQLASGEYLIVSNSGEHVRFVKQRF